jgi:hypothetical protein
VPDGPLSQLDELEKILADERIAVRALDAPAVLAFARRKEALVTTLPNPLPEAARARLRGLTPALRHNGVLLAHARGLLRDALRAVRPDTLGSTSRSTAPSPRLLSVRA